MNNKPMNNISMNNTSMINTLRSMYNDIYIFIPFYQTKKGKRGKVSEITPLMENYIKKISDTSIYECNKSISKQVERKYLGSHKFLYMDDSYEKVVAKGNVEFILTSHIQTNLHILSILFINNEYSITQIEDQVSSKHLYIEEDGEPKITISEYMENEYGFIQCGDEKCLLCLSKKPEDEKEFHCMLAAEAYNSVHIDYNVLSEEISKAAKNNLAVYDFYEAYATLKSLVYISKNLCNNFNTNLDIEAPIIFICEITLLQNAAISRTNGRIVKELSEDVDISLKTIERMYAEFGKTIIFWDKNIYNYSLAQNLADKISIAFDNNKLLDDYYRNQNYLEHLVELKGSISSAREGRILNILAFVLSLSELVQLSNGIIQYVKTGNVVIQKPEFIGTSFGLVVIIFILLWSKQKNKKVRKIYKY